MNKYLCAVSENFLFFIINALLFVILTPLAIRVMGGEFYGLWAVMLALILVSNVGSLGIGAIVMKFSSEAAAEGDLQEQTNRVLTAGYTIAFAMAIITAAFLLLARNSIVNNIETSLRLREQFRIAMLWIAADLLPQFVSRVPNGFLLAQLRNRWVRQIELVSTMSLWFGAIVITLFQKNLAVVAAWCFFSNLLVLGLYLGSVQRIIPFEFRLSIPTLRKLLTFSRYMFIETLAITLFQQFDKVIVGLTLGPILAGVYSVGTSLALRLTIITGQATEVMIPYASLRHSLGDRQKLYLVFRQLSRSVSLAVAGLGSLLVVWMDKLLSLWISANYAALYANAFRVLIISYGLLSLSLPAHQTLTGIGRVKVTALAYSFSTFLMLSGVFILPRRFGFIGAVCSNLVSALLLFLNVIVYRNYGSRSSWRDFFADLQWGLLLPAVTYGFSLFPASVDVRFQVSQTVGLCVVFAIAMLKDTLLRNRILVISRLVLKTRN